MEPLISRHFTGSIQVSTGGVSCREGPLFLGIKRQKSIHVYIYIYIIRICIYRICIFICFIMFIYGSNFAINNNRIKTCYIVVGFFIKVLHWKTGRRTVDPLCGVPV